MKNTVFNAGRPLASFIIICTLLMFAWPFGCKKKNNPVKPDVTNFWVDSQASFVPGRSATITVNSTSLASGTYTVKFDCAGYINSFAGQSATLIMSNHLGTFQTPVLDSPYVTRVFIDSITNSDGLSAALSNNNAAEVSDSTGIMTANISGSTNFIAFNVYTYYLGPNLLIDGPMYSSVAVEDITLDLGIYNNSTGTINFRNDLSGITLNNSSGNTVNYSAYGQIIVTTASPLLAGTFSFTCTDSTKVNGSFSCPAP